MRSVRVALLVLLMLAVVVWAPTGCATSTPTDENDTTAPSDDDDSTMPSDDDDSTGKMSEEDGMEDDGTEPAGYAWLDIELIDVLTGETFSLRDLEGEPVFIQSFAVW